MKVIKNSKTNSNKLIAISSIIVTSLLVTSCSSTDGMFSKRDNGSLDYQNSTLLQPLQIPTNKNTQPFIQLYPTSDLGDSTVNIVNKSGKQYKLPSPQLVGVQPKGFCNHQGVCF